MPLMSYRQYAEHRGCTLAAVQKAIGQPDSKGRRDGRIGAALVAIEGSKHAKIDSDKADALWLLNTDDNKRSLLFDPSGKATSAQAQGSDDGLDDLPDAIASTDPELTAAKKALYLARTQRAQSEAENARLDLEERKRKLIDVEEAAQLGYTTLRTLRDALRNTGARIAAQVAAVSDPYVCEQLINAEIDAALASVTVEKIMSPGDDDDDGGG